MDKQQIEQTMRDYHWMLNEIVRLREYLADAGESITPPYGYETDMPKAVGGLPKNPVHAEVSEREKKWRQLQDYEEKIQFIQERTERITDSREKVILDCLLDGMHINAIVMHMRMSRRNVYYHRERILDSFAQNA